MYFEVVENREIIGINEYYTDKDMFLIDCYDEYDKDYLAYMNNWDLMECFMDYEFYEDLDDNLTCDEVQIMVIDIIGEDRFKKEILKRLNEDKYFIRKYYRNGWEEFS